MIFTWLRKTLHLQLRMSYNHEIWTARAPFGAVYMRAGMERFFPRLYK